MDIEKAKIKNVDLKCEFTNDFVSQMRHWVHSLLDSPYSQLYDVDQMDIPSHTDEWKRFQSFLKNQF